MPNLRSDEHFVEDAGWHQAKARYVGFLARTEGARVLFLELGVGHNTPGIIKYPFWRMTLYNPDARYASINMSEAEAPWEIRERSLLISSHIATTLGDIEKA